MTKDYLRQHVLAMELDRSHIGRLVQLLAADWSVTGTLRYVSQHDNKEWEIDYANGGALVPKVREIYATLTIGPWTGRVPGDQPVTVEYVGAEIEQVDPTRQPEVLEVGDPYADPYNIPGQLELGGE